MTLKGENELERFTDRFGYNKIWSAMESWIDDNVCDFDVDMCNDFALHDIDLKFARNLTVTGSRFEFDAVYNVYVSYTDEYAEEKTKSQWFTIHCAA